jgi:uncharacterized protein YjbJ (UPF0337 family)
MDAVSKGRWLQFRGKMKQAWADLTGDDVLAAEGTADVATGAIHETIGVAKKGVLRRVTRGIDKLAARARRAARSLK